MKKLTCLLALAVPLVLVVPAGAEPEPTLEWADQFGIPPPGPDGNTQTLESVSVAGVAYDASGIYVAGSTRGPLPGNPRVVGNTGVVDGFVRKYDFNGSILWTTQFGTPDLDVMLDMAVNPNGVYVVGYTYGNFSGFNAGLEDAMVVRLQTSDGAQVWGHQIGTPANDRASAVAAGADRVFVVGPTSGTVGTSSSGSSDVFIRKYAETPSNRTVEWTTQFGSAGYDYPESVAIRGADLYIAGYTMGTLEGQFAGGFSDAFAARYSTDGGQIWVDQFGTPSDDDADAVAASKSGIYVTGNAPEDLGGPDSRGSGYAYLRRYQDDGAVVWTRHFGGQAIVGTEAVATSGKGIYVFGRIDNAALPGEELIGKYDVFIRRFEAGGGGVYTKQLGTSEDDSAGDIAASTAGLYVGGQTGGSLPGENFSRNGGDAFIAHFDFYRADALISFSANSGYAGNDVYNATGDGQRKSARVARGHKEVFYVRAENDGDSVDTFRVSGCASSPGFSVRYMSSKFGGTDITEQVTGGVYFLENVLPGTGKTVRAIVEVKNGAAIGQVKSCDVEVTSRQTDVVNGRVEVKA